MFWGVSGVAFMFVSLYVKACVLEGKNNVFCFYGVFPVIKRLDFCF